METPEVRNGRASLARPRRRVPPARVLGAVALAVATAVGAAGCGRATGHGTAGVSTDATASPVTPGADYLALGDSVTFGYREPTTTPKPDYADPATFVAYPEDVAARLGLHVANAACPGETSASLVTAGAANLGCENSPDGSASYRARFPLHVAYSGTQLAYAVSYLRAHPHTGLVTLMIGANDLFLCEAKTKDRCVSEIGSTLDAVRGNVRQILSAVRGPGGYRGRVVLVGYYATDYSAALGTAATQALNTAASGAAAPFGVAVADGYGAFEQAAAPDGGDSCKAGLLTRLSTGTCGIHPSAAGQALLAGAVEKAARR